MYDDEELKRRVKNIRLTSANASLRVLWNRCGTNERQRPSAAPSNLIVSFPTPALLEDDVPADETECRQVLAHSRTTWRIYTKSLLSQFATYEILFLSTAGQKMLTKTWIGHKLSSDAGTVYCSVIV